MEEESQFFSSRSDFSIWEFRLFVHSLRLYRLVGRLCGPPLHFMLCSTHCACLVFVACILSRLHSNSIFLITIETDAVVLSWSQKRSQWDTHTTPTTYQTPIYRFDSNGTMHNVNTGIRFIFFEFCRLEGSFWCYFCSSIRYWCSWLFNQLRILSVENSIQ